LRQTRKALAKIRRRFSRPSRFGQLRDPLPRPQHLQHTGQVQRLGRHGYRRAELPFELGSLLLQHRRTDRLRRQQPGQRD
jgi:hypothetical protein